MASCRSFSFSFILLLSLPLVFLSLSHLSCADNSENITLSLYYEALCPYCADFIVNHLAKIFKNGLSTIVNLSLIPWGNAVMEPDGSFRCQHGPDECFLNTIEACTVTIYPDPVQQFRFVDCVERLALENRHSEWVNCFDLTGLGREPIDCYMTGHGNVLEQKNGQKTTQLNPPHQYVPWVVVNNQPLFLDYPNFMSYICKAYRGTAVPEVCLAGVPEISSLDKVDMACYKTARELTSSAP